jgi:gliding motility-associated-like protein
MVSYYVTQKLAGGCESSRKEVDVTIKPAPAVQFTWTNACEGKATSISATPSSGAQYTWDFGTGASVTGSGSGPYEVTWTGGSSNMVTLKETSGGCQGQVQHLITMNPPPKVGIAPITTSQCAGNTIPLEAYGATTYQWSPATGLSNSDIADPEVRLQNNIQYTVTGTDDNGCTASAAVVLDINPNCLLYSVPDAFSPNGDGKNDVFRVKTGDDPKSFSLIVFNRYGGKVFESANVSIGWDGMIGGNSAPTGTYVYVLQATMSTGVIVKKQGTIVLVR